MRPASKIEAMQTASAGRLILRDILVWYDMFKKPPLIGADLVSLRDGAEVSPRFHAGACI
jgi:hypothetical protein